jgi:hypothetical protein
VQPLLEVWGVLLPVAVGSVERKDSALVVLELAVVLLMVVGLVRLVQIQLLRLLD